MFNVNWCRLVEYLGQFFGFFCLRAILCFIGCKLKHSHVCRAHVSPPRTVSHEPTASWARTVDRRLIAVPTHGRFSKKFPTEAAPKIQPSHRECEHLPKEEAHPHGASTLPCRINSTSSLMLNVPLEFILAIRTSEFTGSTVVEFNLILAVGAVNLDHTSDSPSQAHIPFPVTVQTNTHLRERYACGFGYR